MQHFCRQLSCYHQNKALADISTCLNTIHKKRHICLITHQFRMRLNQRYVVSGKTAILSLQSGTNKRWYGFHQLIGDITLSVLALNMRFRVYEETKPKYSYISKRSDSWERLICFRPFDWTSFFTLMTPNYMKLEHFYYDLEVPSFSKWRLSSITSASYSSPQQAKKVPWDGALK